MQPLPDIQLLGFLDWIDKKGYANSHGVPLEELFLDREKREEAQRLARHYIATRKQYPNTEEGMFEQALDNALAEIKKVCMNSYSDNKHSYWDRGDESVRLVFRRNYSKIEDILNRYGQPRYRSGNIPVTDVTLVDSIRYLLEWTQQDSALYSYLKGKRGTVTNMVAGYMSFFRERTNKQRDINSTPVNVVKQYIQAYLEDEYSLRHINRLELDYTRQVLEDVLFGKKTSQYYHKLINVDSVSDRYWSRIARYKCLFLARNNEFYNLVEQHWEELNDYSGRYLDIFYTPEELTCKGYETADKLNLRGRITDYPAIYIWNTDMDSGDCIPVAGLTIEELLLLVKRIVDEIILHEALHQVVESAKSVVKKLRDAANSQGLLENEFLAHLLKACIALQGNPESYGDASEDQRNTYVRDLLRAMNQRPIICGGQEFLFTVEDQTRIGWSSTGKRSGELDLFVKVNHIPYAIIEGIIVESSKEGQHWNRSNVMEHVRRLGNYDQNGLKRNVLLVYAESDDFAVYCDKLFTALEDSPSCTIKGSKVRGINEITKTHTENANISIAQAEYEYNSQLRTLYIFVVGFEKGCAENCEVVE